MGKPEASRPWNQYVAWSEDFVGVTSYAEMVDSATTLWESARARGIPEAPNLNVADLADPAYRNLLRVANELFATRLPDGSLGGLAAWADSGFVTLRASTPQYEAALMCTHLGDLPIPTLPAKVFVVQFREPILGCDIAICEPHQIRMDGDGSAVFVRSDDPSGILSCPVRAAPESLEGMKDFAFGAECYPKARAHYRPLTSEQLRGLCVARRLIVGLVLAHMQPSLRLAGLALSRAKSLRKIPPAHRFAIVGRPVRCDMRDAVRQYVSGSRSGSGPSVQFVVRGHYTRQPHGPRGSLRRIQWIEPYWKGPEKALILARPHSMGPKETASEPPGRDRLGQAPDRFGAKFTKPG